MKFLALNVDFSSLSTD